MERRAKIADEQDLRKNERLEEYHHILQVLLKTGWRINGGNYRMCHIW